MTQTIHLWIIYFKGHVSNKFPSFQVQGLNFGQNLCRLLDPDLESSGSLFVGSYILQLILHLPSQMAPHIRDLVAALVKRMQSSKIAGLRSSLLVIFARLVYYYIFLFDWTRFISKYNSNLKYLTLGCHVNFPKSSLALAMHAKFKLLHMHFVHVMCILLYLIFLLNAGSYECATCRALYWIAGFSPCRRPWQFFCLCDVRMDQATRFVNVNGL